MLLLHDLDDSYDIEIIVNDLTDQRVVLLTAVPQFFDVPGTKPDVLLIYLTVEFYRPGFADKAFLSTIKPNLVPTRH